MPQEQPVASQQELEPINLEVEELEDQLLSLLLDFDRHDQLIRDRQVRILKRNELFIEGIQNIYFSELAHDYRFVNDRNGPEDYDSDLETKNANILKPYRESIVAALSVSVPIVRFFPADADNPNDLFASNTWSQAAKVLRRKNKAKMLFIRSLSTYWTGGFTAGYTYSDKDSKYGTKQEPQMGEETLYHNTEYCPECGNLIRDYEVANPIESNPEVASTCAKCGFEGPKVIESSPFQKSVITGYEDVPKTQQCIKIFSGLHVQVAPWASDVSQSPYLILNDEIHRAKVIELYSAYEDKIGTSSDDSRYDRWARMLTFYGEGMLTDILTRRRVWFRPWAFNAITDKDIRAKLKALFPKGCKAVFINDSLVDVDQEDLDDHWTISVDPTAYFIHTEPPVNVAIPIQEMTREQRILTLETMRYSIPETFVDSTALDLEKYSEQEVRPGSLTAVRPNSSGNIGNYFYTNKSATLSQEVAMFGKQLIQDGQFATGAFPSIYGGTMEGGSGTASEYSMSRAQALQRLQNFYTVMSNFWADLESKAVRNYLSNLKEDENFVMPQGSGYINIWIRRSTEGKIGHIEPESSEQFPISWAQKKDVIYQLFTLNNDFINEVLIHPENRNFVSEIMGLPELYIPGNADRTKQLYEIIELLAGVEVPIEPLIDDNSVHIEVTKAWLVGEAGIDAKMNNKNYPLVMNHLMMHVEYEMQQESQVENKVENKVEKPK